MLLTKIPKVNQAHGVWNRMTLPKHSFILWLSVQNRFKTKQKLKLYGNGFDDKCYICDQVTNSHSHLFFDYDSSQQVLCKTLEWVDIHYIRRYFHQWILWSHRSYKGNKTRKQVIYTVITAITVQIWRVRKEAYWNLQVYNVDKSVEDVNYIVRHRIKYCIPKNCSIIDRVWLSHL